MKAHHGYKLLCCTVTIGAVLCQSVCAEEVNYIGMSKRKLIRRLGLPAQIELPTESAPAYEIWFYYWDHPQRGVQRADFTFRGNEVSGYTGEFDHKRLISTETAAGFDRVYRYVAQERSREAATR